MPEPSRVYCEGCLRQLAEVAGLPLEQRSPCPACSSLLRYVEREAFDAQLILEDHVQTRHRQRWTAGRGGWAYEATAGDDFQYDSGIWNRLRRVFDRRLNRYEEHIEAPDGTVIRDVQEPLDQHWGHGSAKSRSTKPPRA